MAKFLRGGNRQGIPIYVQVMIFALLCCLARQAEAQAQAASVACSAFSTTTLPPQYRTRTNPPDRGATIEAEERSRSFPVVFLGDSLTQRWQREDWDRHFAPLPALNAGVGGDRTDHLLWRLQNGIIGHQNSKLFVLLIGTNDLTYGRPPAVVAEGIRDVLIQLRTQRPSAQLLLEGLWPRDDTPPMREEAREVNRFISKCHGGPVTYGDFSGAITSSSGQINGDAFLSDRLHLNPNGYRLISPPIERRIRELISLH